MLLGVFGFCYFSCFCSNFTLETTDFYGYRKESFTFFISCDTWKGRNEMEKAVEPKDSFLKGFSSYFEILVSCRTQLGNDPWRIWYYFLFKELNPFSCVIEMQMSIICIPFAYYSTCILREKYSCGRCFLLQFKEKKVLCYPFEHCIGSIL